MKDNFLFKFLLVILGLRALLFIAFIIHTPLTPFQDFQVLFFATRGILHGIGLYDPISQAQMISEYSGASVEMVRVIPFPYVPWFALGTIYLGAMPVDTAMNFWFELNLVMLFLSVHFLTDGLSPHLRLFAYPLAVFFLPSLGTLTVGQYDFPILLGMSLLVYALRKENSLMTAIALALVVIKPHLGITVSIFTLLYLWHKQDGFGKKTLQYTLILGIFLFAISFVADSEWPINYFKSLTEYRAAGHITTCSECASLPVYLSRAFSGGTAGLNAAAIFGLVIAIGCIFIAFLYRRQLSESPSYLVNFAILITLISSPYLYNYDFVLLLVPLAFFLSTQSELYKRILLFILYLIPIGASLKFGRNGNISLILISLFLLAFLLLRIAKLGKNQSVKIV